MKTAKRWIAVFLSAMLMIGLLPCSVFADSAGDDLICEGYFGEETVCKYGGVLQTEQDPFSDLEEDTTYYFTFVPEQTGVYCFYKEVKGITADTDDNRCRMDELEDLLTLHTEDYAKRADFCLLTEGKTYYVLIESCSGISVTYEGAAIVVVAFR